MYNLPVINPKISGIEPLEHNTIFEALEWTKKYYQSWEKAIQHIKTMSLEVSELLQNNFPNKVLMIFWTWFPYYIDKKIWPGMIWEIENFIDETLIKAKRDKVNSSIWRICTDCDKRLTWSNLNPTCKPCNNVHLKPRELFEALPDIDLTLVVDKVTNDFELKVEEILNNAWYFSSDKRFGKVITSVLKSLNSNTWKLPIDIHLLELSELKKHFWFIESWIFDKKAHVRSLHRERENHLLPVGFDFIFSMTPLYQSNSIACEKINQIRKDLKINIWVEWLKKYVKKISKRWSSLLESDLVNSVFENRINKR